MKKIAILGAVLVAATSTSAFAQDSATGTAEAVVVAPITLTHVANASLNFGTFTAGTGGTVTVDQAGNGTAGNDVVLLSTSVESADEFTVAGGDSRTFAITATGGALTGSNGGTMNFTVDAPATGTLSATGAASFNVGGELTVGGAQTAGDYTGTYTVEVAYN